MRKVNFINKRNLIIARENVGMTTVYVSRRITTSKKDVVLSWENGEALPTWKQVERIAKMYNIPEMVLLSDAVIKKNKIIPDYRISKDVEDSKRIKKLVNFVIRRQEWLEKKLKVEGWKNKLQGSGKKLNKPGELALLIKKKLDISLDEIKNITGYNARKKTLKYLIEKAENCGIFIGKTISYHNIEVAEMRGLYVSNDYCPFIILNRRDSISAQIFSLIHELSHFFRKTEAISNSLEFRTTNRAVNREEIFCNQVAVELLLPKNDFIEKYYNKEDINTLSEIYKVSTIAIFYRLKDLNKIVPRKKNQIEKAIKAETEEFLKNKKKQKGGNHTNNMRDSNGGLYNRVVSGYYFENKIGYVEVSNLLKFSVENI